MSGILLYPNSGFYGGSDVATDEVPAPFHCAIGGHPYMLDTKRLTRSTVETTRQGFDPSGEPGEQSLSTEGIWKRWGDDWSFGADQLNYDLANGNSDRRRYYTSEGIDPWTKRGQISMLHATDQKLVSANTNLALLTAGSYLYCADGSNLKYTTDPTPAPASWTTVAQGASIQSITTDGAYVYAAIGTDIKRCAVGSSSAASTFSTQDATLVGYANGRLLAANANVLYEIDSAGVATMVYTHFNASATFVAIVGTPSGIFVGLNNGENGEFLYVGLNATTGALAVPLHAGSLNRGETVYSLRYYQGVVLVGTSRGFREGTIVQDRGIAPGPAIETTAAVRALDVDGEYCWFGLTNAGASGASTGLGRANLTRPTVSTLVPAWAKDVMAAATTGNVLSVARFGSRTYFAVSASGVWGENTLKVSSATLDTGWIRFGTVERLVLYNVDMFHEALAGSISVQVIEEDGITTTLGSSDEAGSIAPTLPLSAQQINSYAFRLKFTFTRSSADTTTGPALLRWTLRALVTPQQVERIMLPLLLSSVVENALGDGQDLYQDPAEEYAYLKGLQRNGSIVSLQMLGDSIPVTVRMVGVPEGQFRGFGASREYLDGIVNVTLMTLEV